MSDQRRLSPQHEAEGETMNGWRATSKDSGSADLEASLDGGRHALLVTRRIANGGLRRRVMLSLGSAERAVALARKAGQPATITLVELRPVGLVDLDDLDGIGGDDR